MAYVEIKTNAAAMQHLQELIAMKNPVAKAGVFAGNEYPDGTPVAMVAAVQEFGMPKKRVPARPFMRPTIKNEKENWSRIFASKARAVANGTMTAGEAFEVIGLKMAGDIRKTIASITSPPLKASTVAGRLRRRGIKKGSKKAQSKTIDKPLVDTGILLASITSKVEETRK